MQVDRAKLFLESCRASLVDTSMRSRLLNYRSDGRGGALEIVGEHPLAVWETVVVRGAKLRLRGVAAKPGTTSTPEVAKFGSGASLGERGAETHRDAWLDVNVDAGLLGTRALRLFETTRSSLQEQGVSTLFLALGFLAFRESESSQETRFAPLLLVPAALSRDGREGWAVSRGSEDPVSNPALAEYLRAQHGISLPPGPDAEEASSAREFDPAFWLQEVTARVASKAGWSVTGDCLLGIFSFQKFVMHEDLRRNADQIAQHPLVRMLAAREGPSVGMTRPPGIDAMNLDAAVPVERHPLVLDADSSQLRAVQSVVQGHSMVIIGPPGTGKSQTIVNVVAAALDAGKTVLFVAEKQAALEVVFDRLKRVGLGTFCFEVHSGKASKAAVVGELRRALDATLAPGRQEPFDAVRLKELRDRLNEYQAALHGEVEPLGLSAFAVLGRLARASKAPTMRASFDVAGVSGEALRGLVARLAELEGAANALPDPTRHPWRGMECTSLGLAARERLSSLLDQARERVTGSQRALESARAPLGLPSSLTLEQACSLSTLAEILARAPAKSSAQLAAWMDEGQAAVARELVTRGRSLEADLERGQPFLRALPDGAGEAGLAALIPAAHEVETRAGRWWRWLLPSWHSARARLRRAMATGENLEPEQSAQALRAALRALETRAALEGDARGPGALGPHWKGASSSWSELAAWLDWVGALRDELVRLSLDPIVPEQAQSSASAEAAQRARELAAAASSLREVLSDLASVAQAGSTWLEEGSLTQTLERVRELAADSGGWRAWGEFHRLRADVRTTRAAPVVLEAEAGHVPWDDVGAAFERRFLELWLDGRMNQVPALARFRASTHEENIAEFRRLDAEAVRHHRGRLADKLKAQAQRRLASHEVADEVTFLRGQLARQKGHAPLRRLLREAGGAIRALKPCFLMSPMTVSMGLAVDTTFDLVIFDEASQLTPEDALGAIARGSQLVVVGDPKQLPPTNFFAVQSGQLEASTSEDPDAPPWEEHESVLEHALAAGLHGTDLRWHYRSRHESLIAYSNRHFYESRLFTFPGVHTDRTIRGLSLVHVPDGVYEGNGVNRVEAKRVVDAIVEHARTRPEQSLGVGTFSLAQQLAVQDELELRRRADPDLEGWLSGDEREPFFVKNLESVQGDERDVMFLSITYGRGADGRLRQNFGPINGPNGARRLNVLTTRSRERMVVFSSMRAEDIDISSTRGMGSQLLRAFLRYAETGSMEGSETIAAMAATESPLEAEMVQALQEAGHRVQPQVGVAGYRIDIGVLDPDVPGRFVCGIEADGVAYHSAESARDRDRLRDEVLRGLGWRLIRVWSLDWWHDRTAVMERLGTEIAAATRAAREERAARDTEVKRPPAPAAKPAGASGPREAATPEVPAAAEPPRGSVTFPPYRTSTPRTGEGGLLEAELAAVVRSLREIVVDEGPLHEDDLLDRALEAWGHSRSGVRLRERLAEALSALGRDPALATDRAFWWPVDREVVARSRAGTDIPAARVKSDEYDAAVVTALAITGPLPEGELLRVLQEAFGWKSATAAQRALHAASLERLRHAGRVGLGGAGVALLPGSPAQAP